MVKWFLFDRVNAKSAGSSISRENDLVSLPSPHKAKTSLPLSQLASSRAEVALDPPVVEDVPVIGGNHRTLFEERSTAHNRRIQFPFLANSHFIVCQKLQRKCGRLLFAVAMGPKHALRGDRIVEAVSARALRKVGGSLAVYLRVAGNRSFV